MRAWHALTLWPYMYAHAACGRAAARGRAGRAAR
eukprot:SAG31_NODE_1626_length_7710_cov_28.409933_10_plen_33_part_01